MVELQKRGHVDDDKWYPPRNPLSTRRARKKSAPHTLASQRNSQASHRERKLCIEIDLGYKFVPGGVRARERECVDDKLPTPRTHSVYTAVWDSVYIVNSVPRTRYLGY